MTSAVPVGRVVERARARTERGELVLRLRTDGHLELRANGVFVMDTLEHSSERALARHALRLVPPRPLRVLVGGLGLGYTLTEVLEDPRVERCDVVEIEPDLVAWMRGGLVPHGPPLVTDPRCRVIVGDVADVLAKAPASSYDVVLLDVDNGPEHLVHRANHRLYGAAGLAAVRQALRPDGLLVVWSATESPALAAALGEAFGQAQVEPYEAPGHGRAGKYWLHLAGARVRSSTAAGARRPPARHPAGPATARRGAANG